MTLPRIPFFLALFLLIFVFLSYPSTAQAVDCTNSRCAECDACGYCLGKDVPENWGQCKACIYPTANDLATDNTTLTIDPTFNRPLLQPEKGKYFTQLGCIDTSLSSFQDAGAAGGVLNFILSRIMFPITGVLAFMSIIYGGFLLATSQDDQMQIQRGRRFVYGGIIGALFTFSVVLIVNTIGSDILRIPGFSKGTPIKISAASTCLEVKGATETLCPILKVHVSKNNVVVEEGVVGEIPTFKVGRPESPTLGNYANFTYYSSQDITADTIGSTYDISIFYDNDETNHQVGQAFRDKNIYIKSISIESRSCSTMVQGNWSNPLALVFITNNGSYPCSGWQ